MRSLAPALAILGVGLLAVPTDAVAYIDPAAGSILLQALLGGVAGILVVGKLYYRKLLKLLGRGRTEPAEPADGQRETR